MKLKVTKKTILNNYEIVLSVGYCGTDDLLRGLSPAYYTDGVYGWNTDVYILDDDVVLVTGYRPFGTCNYNDILEKYNNKAKNINSKNYGWEEQKTRLALNLKKMVEEIKKRSC